MDHQIDVSDDEELMPRLQSLRSKSKTEITHGSNIAASASKVDVSDDEELMPRLQSLRSKSKTEIMPGCSNKDIIGNDNTSCDNSRDLHRPGPSPMLDLRPSAEEW
jgi:hypothetical protein